MDAETLGTILRDRRRRLRLTQAELADIAGVSPRFLHDLEHGKRTVRLDAVLAVAEALGTTVTVETRNPQSGVEA